MSFAIDTNVAIHFRDRDQAVARKIVALSIAPSVSILTVAELEGGLGRNPDLAPVRRAAMNMMIARFSVLPLDRTVVAEYGEIVVRIGFSRRRIIDRLIAATAIVNDLTLITMNGDDFRDIPGLKLEIWPAPAQ